MNNSIKDASNDSVNSPKHYTFGGIECIDAIKAALGDSFGDFCRAQVLKYAWRAGHKDDAQEDMEKAAWYAQEAASWYLLQKVYKEVATDADQEC